MENLNKFISVVENTNGNLKIKCDTDERANIYKWLKIKGFGRFKSDKKVIYFKRENGKIRKSNLLEMNDVFFNAIEKEEFIVKPERLSKEEILNFFYDTKNKPIKNNDLLEYHLRSNLKLDEIDEIEKYEG